MKNLNDIYESLLDDEDAIMNDVNAMVFPYPTVTKIFKKLKHGFDPYAFDAIISTINDNEEISDALMDFVFECKLTDREIISLKNFFKLMYDKYYDILWFLSTTRKDLDYQDWDELSGLSNAYEINNDTDLIYDTLALSERLGFYFKVDESKIDKWLFIVSRQKDACILIATSKNMKSYEKKAWYAFMEAIYRYYN